MIDSSKWEVIEAGLKCVQGKAIVNSISIKEGRRSFFITHNYVEILVLPLLLWLLMRKVRLIPMNEKLKYVNVLTIPSQELNFPPEDIIFDPNIFAVATGIEEHNNYAVDFINATKWIKDHLPHAKISGGVSNVSFSFRGNDLAREAIHTVFLHHAIKAGLTMGIVNAGMIGLV